MKKDKLQITQSREYRRKYNCGNLIESKKGLWNPSHRKCITENKINGENFRFAEDIATDSEIANLEQLINTWKRRFQGM